MVYAGETPNAAYFLFGPGTAAVPAAHTELTANYGVLYEQTLQLCENNEASPMNIDIEQSMVYAGETPALPGKNTPGCILSRKQ